jgi:SAM-dependent methyltransferase
VADYEDYLYTDHPYPETHLDRLAALATLHGLRPAPPDRCSVLELGCGLGGNLIAMAEVYPESTFLGIDRSRRQAAAGRRTVRALGLPNITLRQQDILSFSAPDERYDYIICHGVYSWVPEEVQARILQIAGACLAPQGVAYVSFNTYPGWHLRGALRDMLRRHVGASGKGKPAERIERARALLRDLGSLSSERGPAHAYLASEVRLLGAMDDAYLLYEHLVERNQPCYFADFAAAAAGSGLQYLTDAETFRSFPGHLGEEAEAACQGLDPIERQARLDLLDARFFRRALLCRGEVTVRRTLSPSDLRPLYLTSRLRPMSKRPQVVVGQQGEEVALHFQCEGQKRGVSAHHPLLQAALLQLYEHRPRGLSFPALCAAAYEQVHERAPRRLPRAAVERLGKDLFELLALGYLDVGRGTPAYVTRPGPRPRATALCRLQARRGGDQACTSLLHQSVEVDDLDRLLLARLDGETGVRALCAAVAELITSGELTLLYEDQPVTGTDKDAALLRRIVRQRLARLARSGFLLS